MKGTSNVFSFEDTVDWACPCIVCTSGEKHQRASSYKLGHMAIELTLEIEIAIIMVALYIHLHIRTPAPMPIFLGNPILPHYNIQFSYHYGKDTKVLPLPLWGLMSISGFPLLQRYFKSFRCRTRVWFCMRSPSLQYLGISAHSSYKQGKMDISHTSPTRVWKRQRCRGYSTLWMDISPNMSWFRRATLAYFLNRLIL